MTKYIITDPCYILSRDKWQEICDKSFSKDNEDYDLFNTLTENALNELAKTIDAQAAGTGIGDWCNSIRGMNVLNSGEFCADSGMVCVVQYTPTIEKALSEHMSYNMNPFDIMKTQCIALIEIEGTAQITLDTSDESWTVVEILDMVKGRSKYNYTSELSEFGEDEDEEWDDDNEEDDY